MNSAGVDVKNLAPGDPKLIELIVNHFKSQGIFDQFRKDCLADVDTKPAYQNLRQRVDGNASKFLNSMQWRADLNKNQLRDSVRRQIHESGMLNIGVDRIVDQVVNAKIYQVFMPKITEVVHQFLGIKDGNVDAPVAVKPECVAEKPEEPPAMEPSNTPPHSPKAFSGTKVANSVVPCTIVPMSSNVSVVNKVDCPVTFVKTETRDGSTTPRTEFPIPEAAIQEMNEDTIKLEIKKALEALMETSAAVKGEDEASLVRSKLDAVSSSEATTSPKKQESKLWEAVKDVSVAETKPKVDLAKKDPDASKPKKCDGPTTKLVETAAKPKLEKIKSENVKKPDAVKLKEIDILKKLDTGKLKEVDILKKPEAAKLKEIDILKKLDTAKPKESDKATVKVKHTDKKDNKVKSGETTTKPKLKEHKEKPKSEALPKGEKSPDAKKIHKPKPVETSATGKSVIITDKKKDVKLKDEKTVKTDITKKTVKTIPSSVTDKDKAKSVPKPVVKAKPDSGSGNTTKKDNVKSTQISKKEGVSKKPSIEEAKVKVSKQKHLPQGKESEKVKATKPEDKIKLEKKESVEKCVMKPECEVKLMKVDERVPEKEKTQHSNEAVKVADAELEKKSDLVDDSQPSVSEGKPAMDDVAPKRKRLSTGTSSRKSSRDSRDADYLIGFAAGVREYSDGGYAVARKKRRIKNAESSEEERDDDVNSVGVLSDVTVSSVHTSDLSDFDDHISLTDVEEENAKKNEDSGPAGDVKPKKRGRGRPKRHRSDEQPSDNKSTEKDSSEGEPRRELRRQRRLNPKYASDDFSSIFDKHKGIFHGEREEKDTSSVDYAMITMPPPGDLVDGVQSESPRGNVSTQGDKKRPVRGQVGSPTDSEEQISRVHGDNVEAENKLRSSSCSSSSSPPPKKLRRDRSGSLPDAANATVGAQKETRQKSQKFCSSTGNVARRKTSS